MKSLNEVSKTLSEREKISAIVWLVIGICQCLSIVLIFCGVWNIYASIKRFKHAEAVLTPWRGIVNSYDKWMSNIIIGLVINLIFGGVIGVAGSLYDLFMVRSYVLDNKDVYANAGL